MNRDKGNVNHYKKDRKTKIIEYRKMKKIGIIGIGWLGLPLAQHLRNKNYLITGTTTNINHFAGIQAQVPIQLYELNFERPIDHLLIEKMNQLHCIIVAIPASKVMLNLANILDFFKQIHPSIELIVCSSTGVYPDKLALADESYSFSDLDLQNRNVQLETAFQSLPQRLTILRLAGLIGPKRHPITMLSKKGELSGANSPINLIHQQDVIQVISSIIEKNYFGEIINVCSDEHPSKSAYYTEAANYYQLAVPKMHPENSGVKIVSSEKLKLKLGYQSEFSIFDFEQIPI